MPVAPIEQTLLRLPMAMLLGLVFGTGSCTSAWYGLWLGFD